MLTGCSTSKSYVYSVQAIDKVKVQLDTSDSCTITSELQFTISKDSGTLRQCTFITFITVHLFISSFK